MKKAKKYVPADIGKVKRYSLKDRPCKVETGLMGKPHKKGASLKGFLSSLPDVLASRDFMSVADAIVVARKKGKPVILGMGAHPIKVGLSPLIVDLINRDVITAVASNGACLVHDFELAYAGRTSEDVAEGLCRGMFGMVEETGRMINEAVNRGVGKGLGIGAAMGEFIDKGKFKHSGFSIFRAAYNKKIPATVHVALGADIIHMHPEADGAMIGKGSMRDFLLLASVLGDLEGGVYINLGSAVVLPEVFLKALTVARNLGRKADRITTVNMDFFQHYRARENVLKRPTMMKGASFALTGHHEIMFPLLAAAVTERL